ncbi:MAG: hypothetical protein R2729_02130 [Bryobacteraceae bacterium]
MTRPLRRAHGRIWLVLVVLLPALLALALAVRPLPLVDPNVDWNRFP